MLEYLYLGRMAYDEALKLQNELVELRRLGRIGNTLLLLEHPPVLTLGRNADRSNVLASDELLASRGVSLHQISRGGDVTYHGPGQLIGYPIFDLRSLRNPNGSGTRAYLGPVDFVRLMEEALIRLCGTYGVRAGRIAGLTGVWCGEFESAANAIPPLRDEAAHGWGTQISQGQGSQRKIAAIGIHVSRGITSHGFAFNLSTKLSDFLLINPCGITDKPVTSLEREVTDAARLPGLEAAAHEAARQFGMVFAQPVLAVESLHALRARAAEDTPARPPADVERLAGAGQPSVRA